LSVSIDTNILVYAYDRSDRFKRKAAETYLERHLIDLKPIAGQVLGEFLNTAHRKKVIDTSLACEVVRRIAGICPIFEATPGLRIAASALCDRHKIQFFDALLCQTLASMNVTTLLSEDLSDGETYGGVTILNPFNPANIGRIAEAYA
jgi:predicted nucleic acid-binding protein